MERITRFLMIISLAIYFCGIDALENNTSSDSSSHGNKNTKILSINSEFIDKKQDDKSNYPIRVDSEEISIKIDDKVSNIKEKRKGEQKSEPNAIQNNKDISNTPDILIKNLKFIKSETDRLSSPQNRALIIESLPRSFISLSWYFWKFINSLSDTLYGISGLGTVVLSTLSVSNFDFIPLNYIAIGTLFFGIVSLICGKISSAAAEKLKNSGRIILSKAMMKYDLYEPIENSEEVD